MTRTAIYSLQDNALTIIRESNKCDYPGWDELTEPASEKVPCHESARSLWKDGQKVEEGKDYEVRDAEGVPEHYLSSFPNQKYIAFPLPVKSEDIIERTFSFDETLGYLIDFGNMVLRNRDRLKWDMSNDAAEWLADQLKKIHHH